MSALAHPTFTYVSTPSPDIICGICRAPWQDPVETPCEHIYCSHCIDSVLRTAKSAPSCPECRKAISKDTLRRATRVLRQQVDALHVYCLNKSRGCTWQGPRGEHERHSDSCTSQPAVVPSAEGPVKGTAVSEYDQYSYKVTAKAFAMLHLEAPVMPEELLSKQRKPLHISAVLDKSGSMSGDKIALVISTMEFVIQELTARDTLSIVTYDNNSHIVLPECPMNDSGKQNALAVVRSIRAGGGTALASGLFTGLQTFGYNTNDVCSSQPAEDYNPWTQQQQQPQPRRRTMIERVTSLVSSSVKPSIEKPPAPRQDARPVFKDDDTRSVWLLTDGEATSGIREPAEMSSALRQILGEGSPLSIYTFGFGTPHNESLLSAIAEVSGGVYYFVKDVGTIKDCFADCLGGLMSVVVRDVRLVATAHRGARILRVVGEDATVVAPGGTQCNVVIRDMCSEENRDIVVEVELPVCSAPEDELHTILKWSVQYRSTIDAATYASKYEQKVTRPDIDPTVAPSTYNVQVRDQRARVAVLDALEEAEAAANAGRYDDAKSRLQEAQDFTTTNCATAALAEGLNARCTSLMQKCSRSGWESEGKYAMKSMHMEQKMQRNCTAAPEMQMYSNASRSAMMSKCSKK